MQYVRAKRRLTLFVALLGYLRCESIGKQKGVYPKEKNFVEEESLRAIYFLF
jgi:hypothetical protein